MDAAKFMAGAALAIGSAALGFSSYELWRQPQEAPVVGLIDDLGIRVDFLEERLDTAEAALSRARSAPVRQPVTVEDRSAVLALIDQSIPAITDRITARRLPANEGIEFTFTLVNHSKVVLTCTTPHVEMTRKTFPATADNPNLVEGRSAGEVGLLAPGAEYRTRWQTAETSERTWMQFSGRCSPLEGRIAELEALTSQTGIQLDRRVGGISYGGWTSSAIAK